MADLGPIERIADHSDIVMACRLNFLLFAVPAAIILGVIAILDVPSYYWTPILIVYGIGAMSQVLAFGFEALIRQIRNVGSLAIYELKDQLSGSEPIAPDSL